jgi:hypothetical protein
MASKVLRQESIEGLIFNVVENSEIVVFTGPAWLFDIFKNFNHPQKPWFKIVPEIDPNGNPIIGSSVLEDPKWDFIGQNQIPNPEGTESRYVRDWLIPIPFVFFEKSDEI